MYEVEAKYPLPNPLEFRQRVLDFGAIQEGSVVVHDDTYFSHPCRDFRETTEALRIRRVESDQPNALAHPESLVTYKGPKRPGDVKAREEQEWSLGSADVDGQRLTRLLVSLGFRAVATVRKRRETLIMQHQELLIRVTLDQVEDLGWFTEIETIANDKSQIPVAREAVLSLATALHLVDSEQRSYLALLLKSLKSEKYD